MNDTQAEFNQKMDTLWVAYLNHCKEAGIRPASRQRFAAGVNTEIVKRVDTHMLAQRIWRDVWVQG